MKLNLIIAFSTLFCNSLFAQTTLYAKPAKRVQSPLLGGGAMAWLEPSKKYIVVGLDRENHLLIQHEGGLAICPDDFNILNYRILDGGSFSDSAPITVNKSRSVRTSSEARYDAELSALIPKLYVAFQIYVDGEPYEATASAVTSTHISLIVYIHYDVPSDADIKSAIHYYINGKEIRTVEATEKPFNNPKW